MNITATFMIYALLFRLAVIVAGVVSIVLGYKLFCRGVWPQGPSGRDTNINAAISHAKISVENAAPGTGFALFGVIVIVAMLIQGNPELTITPLHNLANMQLQEDKEGNSGTITLKGGGADSLKALTDEGIRYETDKESQQATIAYEKATALMGEPMNNLAWQYSGSGQLDEALALSKLAVTLSPHQPHFLDTFAEILAKKGDYAEAMKIRTALVKLDGRPEYLEKLNLLKSHTR